MVCIRTFRKIIEPSFALGLALRPVKSKTVSVTPEDFVHYVAGAVQLKGNASKRMVPGPWLKAMVWALPKVTGQTLKNFYQRGFVLGKMLGKNPFYDIVEVQVF